MAYFDHNATSPLLQEVAESMAECAEQALGNASSLHQQGRVARDLLETSREQIAEHLGVGRQELIFTSGGSESNNMVLRQFLLTSEVPHVIVSSVEHPSVLETVRVLAEAGKLEVSYAEVDSQGVVLPETLASLIRDNTRLISIMTANNETGQCQPMSQLIETAGNISFHTDAVQALGKLPTVITPGVQFASLSAHKIGGPCGIGLLFSKEGGYLPPLITGGAQERMMRAGTESAIQAHGFAKAMDWFASHAETLRQQWLGWKQQIINAVTNLPGGFINDAAPGLPNTLNFGFEGIAADSLCILLDLDGIAASTGSACASGSIEPSPVLLAMGFEETKARSCLRVSMGWNTTQSDVDHLIERLKHHHQKALG